MNGVIEELVQAARERAEALDAPPQLSHRSPPSFIDALRGKDRLSVIAEFKQASPSLGAIASRRVEDQVVRYANAGAAAISVLTEPTRFSGSLDDLERAAAVVDVPVLMKDFVVHAAQIQEAASRGASAVL